MTDMKPYDESAGAMSLDYHFTEREIKILARFFRRYQDSIPDGLIDFSVQIERTVYNSMSIEEAEAFYS